eukprot:2316560-Rhodomonas_salina.3
MTLGILPFHSSYFFSALQELYQICGTNGIVGRCTGGLYEGKVGTGWSQEKRNHAGQSATPLPVGPLQRARSLVFTFFDECSIYFVWRIQRCVNVVQGRMVETLPLRRLPMIR